MATDNLRQVLEGYEQERIQLGVTFLNQAMVAATLNDNHECIGKLIKMGAKNIDECIQLAKEKGVINATAMLILLKAALTGDKTLLYIFQTGYASLTPEFAGLNLTRQVNLKIAQAVRSHTISTIHVLEVAQQSGQHSVVQELLLLTRTNELIGSINWSNLHLVSMDRCLVHRMCNWVTALNLSSNKLKSIPAEIEILTKICSVDLNDNNLTNIPASLLQLPNLQMLDLSHNKITHLPDTPQWSTTLSEFNLSDNCLSSLSMNVSASSLMYLNLSKNQFRSVPLCICTFTTLISLDISDNPKIKNLPYELSMLTKLEQLNLNGLKRLKEPPKVFTSSPQKCTSYLRSKFNDGSHCIQLMIVGDPGSGKHTLVSRLQNRELSSRECNSRIYVNEWECRPNITKRVVHFRTWIFNSLEDYTSTHNCFLLQHSLYLLLFNLKCGSKGIHEVKVWLESITHEAPYSSVMVIGTHKDEMSHEDYRNGDFLLQQAKMVAAVYENKLESIGLFQIELKRSATQLLDNIHSYAVNYPLLQRAIIREIGTGGERVEELLNCGRGKLDLKFLNHALEFATQKDNDVNIGKIALAGPVNIKQCIMLAEREGKHHAHVMLLMIMAALSGDKDILNRLSLEPVQNEFEENNIELLSLVHCRLFSVNVSSNVPIEIAQQSDQIQITNELLMKTNVYPDEEYVCWRGLQLRELDISLLKKIHWVKKLWLSRNRITTLPQEMGMYLRQVTKIDLQNNDLTTIPRCLLELPSLGKLNLAHNRLQEIPEVPEWSPCLTVLDLSNNQLSSLPSKVKAPAIRSLNISRNKFHTVPLCICSFTTLHSLTLSENPNIVALPVQMGRLGYLSHLNLSGLINLREPPKNLQKECRDCIRYLNSKLRSPKGFYRMKLMLLGYANRGKTTLVARLQGKEHISVDELTLGVNITEWGYRPSIGRRAFHFSIWDFAGEEEYYATHQCFLSQCSLYLLLFNLKHGDKGVEELRMWLNNLALRAPHSCVIIIGTHLDEVPDEERGEIDVLLHRVGNLAASYINKLQIMEVLPVGLKNHIENIGLLKEAIYNHAANYKNQRGQLIMGQKIPASYHALDKQLELVQQEVRQGIREPIMHVKQFKTMVHQMNFSDIQDDEELRTATLFLTDVGSLLHYDERRHNLHELYFVDPHWLGDLMAKIAVTIGPFVKNGILYFEDIPMLFKSDKRFPWQYFKQFLTLLDRFEIALALDNRRVLVPSILPGERPKELIDEKSDKEEPTYSRFIIFNPPTPPGFWSRLLSRIMHSIPIISYALDKSTSGSQPVPSSYYFDPKEIHLEYWRTGLYYKDQDVMFRIESLLGSKQFKRETKDGILAIATANNSGKKIICQLIDLVLSLVSEWYPGLQEGKHGSSGLEQKVPCFECIKHGRAKPFEFKVEQCIPMIVKNETTMECGYFRDDPAKNHTVSMVDIVPDLLLQDIDSRFLLNAEEIDYDEDDTTLLGKGGYGKVYQGKCKGKSVAIKKYLSRSEEAVMELRNEAKILQKLRHPCIVDFVGVCVQPLCTLVLEKAPLKSLEFSLLKKKIPVHRLTMFRIATEVAAALYFMHSQGIIKRGVKAADVLLWTLDPDSLCHCKLCDFGISTHLSPIGARGLQGSKTIIAPEVLYIGKRKQRSTYDHRADIFSFGMFLYQMIARRHPYHNIPLHRIDVAIESGERPKLQDVHISHTGYHYLTKVMKVCWEDNPNNRFDTNIIIKKLCQLQIQMVMCVASVKSKLSLRRATAITPSNFTKAGYPNQLQSELWLCCDSDEGVEIIMFSIHTMVENNHIFIKDKQIQCMALCGDQVWLGSRSGIEYGVIDIFSIGSREAAHNIHVHESQSVTCITATDKGVYMGTLEGYCLSYSDISEVQANVKPRCKYVSEYAIDGIICTQQYVWIAHTNCICLLSFDDLSVACCIHRETGQQAYIGQLSFDSDHIIVWSANLGSVILSAWDAHNKCHMYDINTGRHLKRIADAINDADSNMTAMTPALDTVWVGMATGHIMVFHEEDLLAWFHPYEGYVRFLTCIPSAGPCGLEKAMVASGGKQFRPLVEGLNESDKSSSSFESGTLIIWEAYEAKTMKQMKLIEQNSPAAGYLNNHDTVRQMIQQGGFKDGTNIMPNSAGANMPTDIADRKTPPPPGQSFINIHTLSESPIGSFTESLISSNEENTDLPSLQARVMASCVEKETFNIKLPDSERSILVRCPKPVILKVLHSEVEVMLAQDECPLMYYKDGKAYRLQNQEDLDEYTRLPKKPQLYVENADSEIVPKIYHATDKSSEEEVNVKIVGPMEQSLKLTCSKPAQLDSLLNEIISLGNLKSQKFNVMYLASNSEIEVNTKEDFDDYLVISNRPPLLVKLEQNMSSSNFNEDSELNCSASSTTVASKIPLETTEDMILHFKVFNSEHILDMTCTKPLRLEAVLNDLKLITNLGDREWQLVYSVDESYIKIETQEDFEKYLSTCSASMPTLWITSDGF